MWFSKEVTFSLSGHIGHGDISKTHWRLPCLEAYLQVSYLAPKRGIVLLTFGLTKLFPFVRQACSCAGATRMMLARGSLNSVNLFASFQVLASSNNVICFPGFLETITEDGMLWTPRPHLSHSALARKGIHMDLVWHCLSHREVLPADFSHHGKCGAFTDDVLQPPRQAFQVWQGQGWQGSWHLVLKGLQKTLNGFPCCLGEGLLFYLFWALERFGSNYKLGDPPSTVGTASPVHPTCAGGQKYSLMKYSNTFCGTSDQVACFRTVCGIVRPELLVNRVKETDKNYQSNSWVWVGMR